MEQLKFKHLQTSQHPRKNSHVLLRDTLPNTNDGLKQLLSPQEKNRFYQSQPQNLRFSQKSKNSSLLVKNPPSAIQTLYDSPLLPSEKLDTIEKLKKLEKNDFYGHLHLKDPYEYPKDLTGITTTPKQPNTKVYMPGNYSSKQLSLQSWNSSTILRKSKDKLHRGIPQKHDIKALAEWVDLMIEQAVKQCDKPDDLFERLQDIFTYCLKELVRQISIDCVEKGVLLEKIWNQYVEINHQVVESLYSEKRQSEKEHLSQVKRTHQLYQQQIDNYLLIIKNLETDKSILQGRFTKVKDNGKYLKKTNRNLQRDFKLLKFDLNDTKNQNKYLQDELEKFKEYLEEAERDMKNQYQQRLNFLTTLAVNQIPDGQIDKPQPTPSSTRRKLARSETQSFFTLPEPPKIEKVDKQNLKILRVSKKNKTMINQPTPQKTEEVKVKPPPIEEDSFSEDMSNLENITAEKSTSTEDLIEILELNKNQAVQTIVSKMGQEKKPKPQTKQQYLRPDQRQQICQTGPPRFQDQDRACQTELREEMIRVIEEEEAELISLNQEIMKVQEQYAPIDESQDFSTGTITKKIIKDLMGSISQVSTKFKKNLTKQRDLRHSLMIQSSVLREENTRQSEHISSLQQRNSALEHDLQMFQNEVQELEQQVEVYDEINKKMEKKYSRVKNKKLMLLEKTQNLVTNISKTYQFRDILKKKVLEKRRQKANLSPRSPRSQGEPDQAADDSQQSPNNVIPEPPKKWNIHISQADNPIIQMEDEQRSRDKDSFYSQNVDLDQSVISQKSDRSGRNTGRSTRSPTKNQNYSLVPGKGSKKPQQAQKKVQAPPQKKGAKPILSATNLQSQDQIKFIQDTIQNFLNENASEDNSSDSSFSVSSRLQELENRKQRIQSQRKGMQITLPQAPKFNHRSQDSQQLVNLPRSQLITAQIAEKIHSNPKSIKAKMQKINVLKMIAQFYAERIKQFQNKNIPLHLMCYEYYFNTYGFKNLAEQKLANFYLSIYAYNSNSRINLFGRFLELFNPLNLDDLEIYLQSLKTLDENENALNLAQVVNEKGVYVLSEKAITSLESQHSGIPQDFKQQICKDLKLTQIERHGKPQVDLDLLLSKILEGYHMIRNKKQGHFEEVFYAADMDLDGMIEYQEFRKLFEHFEKNQGNKMNEELVQREFLQKCDLIAEQGGEKAMSFSRFVTFSIENNLFTEEKYNTFAKNISSDDPIKSLEDLSNKWGAVKEVLLKRINFFNEDNDYFDTILKKLDKALKSSEKRSCLWISYRILDTDTKQLYLKKIVLELIPSAFHNICETLADLQF